MNTGAELGQYFVQTQLKTFNGGWTPLTPSVGMPVLWYLNGYGVKEIQSTIWPAVYQLIIISDMCHQFQLL